MDLNRPAGHDKYSVIHIFSTKWLRIRKRWSAVAAVPPGGPMSLFLDVSLRKPR
jgi:hypothetical protein